MADSDLSPAIAAESVESSCHRSGAAVSLPVAVKPPLPTFSPRPIPFSIRFAVGPMVGQSDHAFRMLTRAHGATVAYTPMLYADRFDDPDYLRRAIDFDPNTNPMAVHDRPLIVQFAAKEPQQLLRAAKYVETMCDAIDINLG